MLEFDDLFFVENENKVKVIVYKYYSKEFDRDEIVDRFGEFSISKGKIKFEKKQSEKKFMQFFRGFKKDLTFALNGNKAVYIDEDLEMPLIGLQFIGIVDKGNKLLEIKPVTNCNCDCSFCSVDEGMSSKKEVDFVVGKDFLVESIEELLDFKQAEGIEVWLNPHGESTLYDKLVELCEDLLKNKWVSKVAIITNGILFNGDLAKRLAKVRNGKEIKVALSISGVDKNREIMGKGFCPDAVIKNIEEISKILPIDVTPVVVNKVNEDDISKIIDITKDISKKVGKEIPVILQKFYYNRRGRNPAKEVEWDDFVKDVKKLEKEKKIKLLFEWGEMEKTKQLSSVCRKGEQIKVRIVSDSRFRRDKIGVLETNKGNRAVVVANCNAQKGLVKAKVVQCKYNMILAS